MLVCSPFVKFGSLKSNENKDVHPVQMSTGAIKTVVIGVNIGIG